MLNAFKEIFIDEGLGLYALISYGFIFIIFTVWLQYLSSETLQESGWALAATIFLTSLVVIINLLTIGLAYIRGARTEIKRQLEFYNKKIKEQHTSRVSDRQ